MTLDLLREFQREQYLTNVLEVVPSDPDVGAIVGQISSDSNDETELPEWKRMGPSAILIYRQSKRT